MYEIPIQVLFTVVFVCVILMIWIARLVDDRNALCAEKDAIEKEYEQYLEKLKHRVKDRKRTGGLKSLSDQYKLFALGIWQ